MLYEYSLIPDVFDPALLYCNQATVSDVMQLLRGIADCGLLANLHRGDWSSHVAELLTEIPDPAPTERRITPTYGLQECLTLLHDRNRLVRHPRRTAGDPTSPLDWLNLAIESHARRQFDGIIMTEDLLEDSGLSNQERLVALHESLNAEWWTKRRRSVTVSKRVDSYASALAPIFRYAKSVTLVDPYMDPRVSRWLHIVDIVREYSGETGHAAASSWNVRLQIHAGNPEQDRNRPQQPGERLAVWQSFLQQLPRRFRTTVFLWDKDISGPRPHDRYVLTNQCGVSCPGGLDCYEDSSSSTEAERLSTWHLLEEETRAVHAGEYAENSSTFRLLGSREVIGQAS